MTDALPLTLLVDFAFENYPKAGRDRDEIRSRLGRFLSEVWRIGWTVNGRLLSTSGQNQPVESE
jgi:hypothetical protein